MTQPNNYCYNSHSVAVRTDVVAVHTVAAVVGTFYIDCQLVTTTKNGTRLL